MQWSLQANLVVQHLRIRLYRVNEPVYQAACLGCNDVQISCFVHREVTPRHFPTQTDAVMPRCVFATFGPINQTAPRTGLGRWSHGNLWITCRSDYRFLCPSWFLVISAHTLCLSGVAGRRIWQITGRRTWSVAQSCSAVCTAHSVMFTGTTFLPPCEPVWHFVWVCLVDHLSHNHEYAHYLYYYYYYYYCYYYYLNYLCETNATLYCPLVAYEHCQRMSTLSSVYSTVMYTRIRRCTY